MGVDCSCIGGRSSKVKGDENAISYDDWDDLKRIFYARSVSMTPNDSQEDAYKENVGLAQEYYG